MPRIFLTNYSGFDFKKAERFGDKFTTLTRGYIDVKSVEQINELVASEIQSASEDDYLLLFGPTILCCIITFLWLKYHPICKTLVWKKSRDSNDGDYEEVILVNFDFDPPTDTQDIPDRIMGGSGD